MCVCECQGPWILAEDIDLLELELLVIASYRLWTLGTEFRSSARGVSDLKHRAISPGSES